MQSRSNESTILIKQGDFSDLDQLAELHYTCFKSHENIAVNFGKNFVRAVYKWFLTSEITYTIVATVEDQVVGLTTVCDSPYIIPMFKNCLLDAIIGIITHPAVLYDRSFINQVIGYCVRKPYVSMIDENNLEIAYLAYIAVHPDYQGQRIGSKLLIESKRIAAERGKFYHRAGIYKHNIASQRMFENCGHIILKDQGTKDIVLMQAKIKDNVK